MRKSAKLITALSVAALVGVAGSAFTASNTVPAEGVSGYGETVATGVDIDTITKTLLESDKSRLDTVTYISTTVLTADHAAYMTLKNVGVGEAFRTYGCSIVVETKTITCDATDNPVLSGFDTTGLTLTDLTVSAP